MFGVGSKGDALAVLNKTEPLVEFGKNNMFVVGGLFVSNQTFTGALENFRRFVE